MLSNNKDEELISGRFQVNLWMELGDKVARNCTNQYESMSVQLGDIPKGDVIGIDSVHLYPFCKNHSPQLNGTVP